MEDLHSSIHGDDEGHIRFPMLPPHDRQDLPEEYYLPWGEYLGGRGVGFRLSLQFHPGAVARSKHPYIGPD